VFLTAIDLLAGNSELPPELEPFRPFVKAKKVAVLTDLPYGSSGTDKTSGPPLSRERIEVCSSTRV
jgi:hypothetical protein